MIGAPPMKIVLIAPLPLLFLAACSPSVPANTTSIDINAAAVQAQDAVDAYDSNAAVEIGESDAASNTAAPLDPPAPGTPGGLANDRTPISEARFTADSAQGAADLVQTYFALVGERKYAEAFALREPATAGAPTADAFAVSFARYAEYHANVGAPGAIEAAAGQRYVAVPVQVYARLKEGRTPVYQIGRVTLHRTSAVDGASATQRAWRIRTIDLQSAPKR